MSNAENFRCPFIEHRKDEWIGLPSGADYPLVNCTNMSVETPDQAIGKERGNRRCRVWYPDEGDKQLECYTATQIAKFRSREPLQRG